MCVREVLAGPFDCSSQIYSCLCYCCYLFGLRNCNLNVFNVILVVRLCRLDVCLGSWHWSLVSGFSLTVNCLLAPDVLLIAEHHRPERGQLIGV